LAEPTVGNRLTTRFPSLNKKSIAIESETDWARLDAMTDADIDLSDCPEVTPETIEAQTQPETLENYLSLTYPLAERTVGNRALPWARWRLYGDDLRFGGVYARGYSGGGYC
jgi:hypothetical protein